MTRRAPGQTKIALRARIRAELSRLSAQERQRASAEVCARFRSQALWQRAAAFLFYAPLRQEIDITPLLSQALHDGKQVALLRFEPFSSRYLPVSIDRLDELLPGKFGILEPPPSAPTVSLSELDLALVPGVAFDPCGRRLGRGQGHYDQLLAAFPGLKCGIAFDLQIVDQIPVEAHDVLMDYVLTPTRWLEIESAPA